MNNQKWGSSKRGRPQIEFGDTSLRLFTSFHLANRIVHDPAVYWEHDAFRLVSIEFAFLFVSFVFNDGVKCDVGVMAVRKIAEQSIQCQLFGSNPAGADHKIGDRSV